jgi:hypothetical protein
MYDQVPEKKKKKQGDRNTKKQLYTNEITM